MGAKPPTSVPSHLVDVSNTEGHNSNLFTLQVDLAYLHLAAFDLSVKKGDLNGVLEHH